MSVGVVELSVGVVELSVGVVELSVALSGELLVELSVGSGLMSGLSSTPWQVVSAIQDPFDK